MASCEAAIQRLSLATITAAVETDLVLWPWINPRDVEGVCMGSNSSIVEPVNVGGDGSASL